MWKFVRVKKVFDYLFLHEKTKVVKGFFIYIHMLYHYMIFENYLSFLPLRLLCFAFICM